MATRSAIGFVEYDGSVRAIYCHWDGYPDHNGKMLEEHYDSIEKVEELLDFGDISDLESSIDKLAHCSGKYYPALDFDNSFHFMQYYRDMGCKYFYLFDGNEWIVADHTGEFKPMGLVVSD